MNKDPAAKNKQIKTTPLPNTQIARVAQYQKAPKPNQKIGRRSKQTFIQRRHIDGQQTHEKMLNINNYYRNGNQNYKEVLQQS